MTPKDDLKPVPLTLELQLNYQRLLEVGARYPSGPERVEAIRKLLQRIGAEKAAKNN